MPTVAASCVIMPPIGWSETLRQTLIGKLGEMFDKDIDRMFVVEWDTPEGKHFKRRVRGLYWAASLAEKQNGTCEPENYNE